MELSEYLSSKVCGNLGLTRFNCSIESYICFFLLVWLVTIESTGALPPEVLFTEAVKILEDKCERVIAELSWFFFLLS